MCTGHSAHLFFHHCCAQLSEQGVLFTLQPSAIAIVNVCHQRAQCAVSSKVGCDIKQLCTLEHTKVHQSWIEAILSRHLLLRVHPALCRSTPSGVKAIVSRASAHPLCRRVKAPHRRQQWILCWCVRCAVCWCVILCVRLPAAGCCCNRHLLTLAQVLAPREKPCAATQPFKLYTQHYTRGICCHLCVQ